MRIPGLDGLRAIAVTGVLLYHGGLHATPAGFLGVDLFFVISGFLITTLLLQEAAAGAGGRIDVIGFWGRRVRRLLPGLALVTGTTLLVFTTIAPISETGQLRRDALAALLYVANWHLLGTGDGYFQQFALPSPLQHTWSLAIEEQFYFLWPIVLLIALRLRAPRWVQASGVAVAALSSAAWMAYLIGVDVDDDRVYFGTDTRAQTILVGVVAALLLEPVINDRATGRREASKVVRRVMAAVGVGALGCVVVAMVTWRPGDHWLYRGGSLTFALVSGVLIAAVVAAPGGMLTRGLEARPLRHVGVLSYGLYLWHWPVFLFLTAGRTSLAGPALLGVRLATTLALAVAAYHLVEARLRHAAWQPPRAVALPVGVAGLACGAALLASSAIPEPTRQTVTPAAVDLHEEPDARAAPLPHVGVRRPTSIAAASPAAGVPHPLRVTLLGDSTALTLGDGLRDVPGIRGVDFFNAAILGCGVTTATPYRYMGVINPYAHRQCHRWEARWRNRVSSRPADVVAILVGRWEVADQVVDGTWTHVGTPLFDAYVAAELQKALDAASITGAPVALLTAPYYSRGEQPDGSTWPEDDPARVDAFNKILHRVAARHPGLVQVVEFGRRSSGGGHRYMKVVDGVVLRYDGVHFTSAAAQWIQPWLRHQLEKVARGTA
jgi:peptidoglycan/LPS O-acetylase OafA/YrhL